MDMDFVVPYAISAGTIVLGFVALLTQKIYVDKDTKEATEIEVPFLGKMKSNFPALVFVFLGVVIALWVFNKQVHLTQEREQAQLMQEKVLWTIKGKLEAPEGNVDLRQAAAAISVTPTDVNVEPDQDGYFTITARIEKGKNFTDAVQLIDCTYGHDNWQVNTKEEFDKYNSDKRESSLIEYVGANLWKLKPIKNSNFSAAESGK